MFALPGAPDGGDGRPDGAVTSSSVGSIGRTDLAGGDPVDRVP